MAAPHSGFEFDHAIVREPAASVAAGLRAVDRGNPDVRMFRSEHAHYCAALEASGLTVHRLPALDDFPDSVFVEDPALVLPEIAILLPAAAPSRRGEAAHLETALGQYRPLARVDTGFVDGGDILVAGRDVFVGLSSRTDRRGTEALGDMLAPFGCEVRAAELPPGLLHLKTGCALLDGETVLVVEKLAATGIFSGFRLIRVPAGEEAAANAVRVNGTVLVADGNPETADILTRNGYDVTPVPTAQAAMLDGGLSCMSLRFQAEKPA